MDKDEVAKALGASRHFTIDLEGDMKEAFFAAYKFAMENPYLSSMTNKAIQGLWKEWWELNRSK